MQMTHYVQYLGHENPVASLKFLGGAIEQTLMKELKGLGSW